jgi:hypothetical protein
VLGVRAAGKAAGMGDRGLSAGARVREPVVGGVVQEVGALLDDGRGVSSAYECMSSRPCTIATIAVKCV